jgi:30S ribosome assembly GTPase
MSKVNVVRRCYSCGVILQTSDKKKEGYVNPDVLERPLDTVLFCEKCYKEKAYNIAPAEASVSPDFLTMLLDAKASDALIVYVVDLVSFECSFNTELIDTIKGLNVLVLANKRDLMPKEAKDADLKEYVAHRFRVASLPVQASDVLLLSLTTLVDLTEVKKVIEKRRKRHDVYIIGPIGAGKSFFLSAYLRNFDNPSGKAIVTADYPGTHLSVMQIPLDRSSMIYDTPGTGIDNSLRGKAEPEVNRVIVPESPLKKRSFTLAKGESLLLGGLARLDLLSSDKKKLPLNAYFASGVQIKKVLHHGEEAFQKSLAKDALKPSTHLVKALKDLDVYDVVVDELGSRDLGIAGLGWFNFPGLGETFRIYVPKGVSIYTSRAKIK